MAWRSNPESVYSIPVPKVLMDLLYGPWTASVRDPEDKYFLKECRENIMSEYMKTKLDDMFQTYRTKKYRYGTDLWAYARHNMFARARKNMAPRRLTDLIKNRTSKAIKYFTRIVNGMQQRRIRPGYKLRKGARAYKKPKPLRSYPIKSTSSKPTPFRRRWSEPPEYAPERNEPRRSIGFMIANEDLGDDVPDNVPVEDIDIGEDVDISRKRKFEDMDPDI